MPVPVPVWYGDQPSNLLDNVGVHGRAVALRRARSTVVLRWLVPRLAVGAERVHA